MYRFCQEFYTHIINEMTVEEAFYKAKDAMQI